MLFKPNNSDEFEVFKSRNRRRGEENKTKCIELTPWVEGLFDVNK